MVRVFPSLNARRWETVGFFHEHRQDKCMVSRFVWGFFLKISSILSNPSIHTCHLYERNALIVKNVDRNITVWSKAWNDFFCSVSCQKWSNSRCSVFTFCSNVLVSGVSLLNLELFSGGMQIQDSLKFCFAVERNSGLPAPAAHFHIWSIDPWTAASISSDLDFPPFPQLLCSLVDGGGGR